MVILRLLYHQIIISPVLVHGKNSKYGDVFESSFRLTSCKVISGENEVYAIHDFKNNDVCFDSTRKIFEFYFFSGLTREFQLETF